MVALLQDFLRALGLTEGFVEGASPPVLSVSEGPSAAASVISAGPDAESVRGDLCGGAVSELVWEHLLGVCLSEFTLVYRFNKGFYMVE